MNPRQRRGVLLMFLAAVGAIAVFVSVLSYVSDVRAEIRERTEVLMLTQDVPAFDRIAPSAVTLVQVPRKWSPQTMIGNTDQLIGKVAATNLPRGAYLQQGMLTNAPDLQPGEREIAIMINAETGVAGKVRPGSVVDIYATFQEQQQRNQRACAIRVIGRARVIQIGQLRTQRPGQAGTTPDQVVPITFALSAQESLNLTYAESFATKVRLALISPRGEPTAKLDPVCTAPIAR